MLEMSAIGVPCLSHQARQAIPETPFFRQWTSVVPATRFNRRQSAKGQNPGPFARWRRHPLIIIVRRIIAEPFSEETLPRRYVPGNDAKGTRPPGSIVRFSGGRSWNDEFLRAGLSFSA
jgi:hypothetical protein